MILGVMWMMTAVVVGFMLGRVSMYGQAVPEEEMGAKEPSKETPAVSGQGKHLLRRGRGHRAEAERACWAVGSPVSGEVIAQRDGERPTVAIYPDSGCLYAPAGGKITRLFPMGNAFLLATEFGAELYIQVGDGSDDLLARHYRPRVVQNEVVGKGKLLLEFDRQGLEAEGVSAEVSVTVENCLYGGGVRMTAGEQVKSGEEILQVQEAPAQEVRLATVRQTI